jgi:hypothetical protein
MSYAETAEFISLKAFCAHVADMPLNTARNYAARNLLPGICRFRGRVYIHAMPYVILHLNGVSHVKQYREHRLKEEAHLHCVQPGRAKERLLL